MQGRQRFLRVTSGHLFEVELQAARTLERLELQSLEAAEIESETQTQREPAPEVSVGVWVLEEMLGFSQEPVALGNLGPHGFSLVPRRELGVHSHPQAPWEAGLGIELLGRSVDVGKSFLTESRAVVSLCALAVTLIPLLGFSGPLWPHRTLSCPLGPRSLLCASLTFARTGICVAMWCWSLMPTQLSR